MGWTGLDSTSQKNIWCYLIRSKGLNLLRYFTSADEDLPPSYLKRCRKYLDSLYGIKHQAPSSRQDYINGEKLQHALGWKGSSDFGPKPQASSALKQTQLKGNIKT